MADDIVKQLEWLRDEFYDVDGVTAIVELAANEIERLRVAGDVIAGVLAALVGDRKDVQRLLNTWEEARRG